jgi:hypothetical protein
MNTTAIAATAATAPRTAASPAALTTRPRLPQRRAGTAAAFSLALVMTLATLAGIDQLAQPAAADALWAQPASTATRA